MILGDGFILVPPPVPDEEGFMTGPSPSSPDPALVTAGVRFASHLVRASRASGRPFLLRIDDILDEWNALDLLQRDPGVTEVVAAYDVILAQTLPHLVERVPLRGDALRDHVHAGVYAETLLFSSVRFSEATSAVYVALLGG